MTILEMLKTLLNIELEDYTKDAVLNFYLKSAKVKIAKYLRITIDFDNVLFGEENEQKYLEPIVTQAKFEYSNQKTTGVKQYSESKRSVTYKDDNNGLISEVKAMLSLPSIVMF